MPGYSGSDGQQDTLSGQPAWRLGGPYTEDGVKRVVAQKTVVIQSGGGLYVLQLKATGLEADRNALAAATGVIDEKTTITP